MTITAPTDLPGLWLWLDGSDSSSITLVSGRVSQINDKSGAGNHATQATATARPFVYTADQGGLDTFGLEQFPNAGSIGRTSANMQGGTTMTVCVMGVMQDSAGKRFMSLNSSGMADWNNAGSVALNAEGSFFPTGYRNGNLPNDGTWHGDSSGTPAYFIYTWRWTGTTCFIYYNATLVGSGSSSGTWDIDQYTLGAEPGGGSGSYARFGDVVISSSDLGDPTGGSGNLYDLWYYYDQKWSLGLGLPPGSGGGGSFAAVTPVLLGQGAALTRSATW